MSKGGIFFLAIRRRTWVDGTGSSIQVEPQCCHCLVPVTIPKHNSHEYHIDYHSVYHTHIFFAF
jgi:hypothetical protein